MQIDQIRITDVIKADKSSEMEGGFPEKHKVSTKQTEVEPLRRVQVDHPFYNKKSLQSKTVADELEEKIDANKGAMDMHNEMAVYSQTMSEEDFEKMMEDGINPMEMDSHTIVTVTDRIKVALAKAGKDISAMGGVAKEVVRQLSAGEFEANKVMDAMKEVDVPVDEKLMKEAKTAFIKATELPEQLSSDAMHYILSNQLEPTIQTMYQSSYATSNLYGDENTLWEGKGEVDFPDELRNQVEQVIYAAGYEPSEEVLADCSWMMDQDIALTADNLTYLQDLKAHSNLFSMEEIAESMANAVAMGKSPEDAYVIPKYDLMAKAKEVAKGVFENNSGDELADITARRTLEEARLVMSVQANYQLLKKGIAIDTMVLADVVEELKKLEDAFLSKEMGQIEGSNELDVNVKVDLYKKTKSTIQQLSFAPAVALAKEENIGKTTMEQMVETARPLAYELEQAQERYDTMKTDVRTDLGDSMKKAFANVDDIVEDLGYELTDRNRRAIRILAYNQMSLTEENVEMIKANDAKMQRLFSAMKPATVLAMIKDGKNPLDMAIEDLTNMAEEYGQDAASEGNQENEFAKFLWKMQKTDKIDEKQRESFVGVYRLLHQISNQDGAVLGAVLQQKLEPTLRNLMTAARSRKHENRSYKIDDSFGEREALFIEKLSITEQIELAFQKDCAKEAKSLMTPRKMMAFASEDEYMDMTPETFADALKEIGQQEEVAAREKELETHYRKEQMEQMKNALASEDEVYRLLEQNDMPTTPAFLEGIQQMLADRNQVYRSLVGLAGQKEESASIEDIMEDIIEDFGEALKTPEEMAEAERKLEETAENVMKDMLVEREVSTTDLRQMKLVTTQIKAIGEMAKKSETYHIPILVEDQLGNLTLKIVRGKEKKGLVDVALDMEQTGAMRASFRYEAGNVEGELSFEKQEMRTMMSEHMQLLASRLAEDSQMGVSLSFAWDHKLNANHIYFEEKEDYRQKFQDGFERTEEKDEISTKALYGIARSFISALTEMIS